MAKNPKTKKQRIINKKKTNFVYSTFYSNTNDRDRDRDRDRHRRFFIFIGLLLAIFAFNSWIDDAFTPYTSDAKIDALHS